ncbi:MAG: hypothetical protein J0H40_17915 [Rhizobiales bacterium]|nr:hypothetical protein [Hyphomicrobiales bacterium]
MSYKLGDKLKDTITGFTGIATSKHEYLNGCVRWSIQPDKCDKDGKPPEPQTFDMEQLVLVKAAKPRTVQPSGGPRNEPSRPSIPSR